MIIRKNIKTIGFSRKYSEEFTHNSKNSNITKIYKFPLKININFKNDLKSL